MKNETMTLVFTSFRDSISLEGLKVAIDYHTPKLCSYPTATFMVMPNTRNLSNTNLERICNTVLDNNWELLKDFIMEVYGLGISQIVFCDWATKEQIAHGKFCPAGIIERYIRDKVERDAEFEFPIKITMRDGREVL